MEKELRPEQIVYGKHETKVVLVSDLIRLAQVRRTVNPERARIKESILNRGNLINLIDVAFMKQGDFETYLHYQKTAWGKTYDISEFEPDKDGYYRVVAAGNTRHDILLEIQEEEGQEVATEVKVYKDMTTTELLALQIDENLHDQPPLERQAQAIVEIYRLGLFEGEWASVEEFSRSNSTNFSKYRLRQAIKYMRLPESIREFVDIGTLEYLTAVELGKSIDIIEEYHLRKHILPYEDSAELDDVEIKEKIAELVESWLRLIVSQIHEKRLSRAAANSYVKSRIGSLKEAIDLYKSDAPQLELEMVGFNEQLDIEKKRRLKEYRRAVANIAAGANQTYINAALLHADHSGDPALFKSIKEQLDTARTQVDELVH